MENMTVMTANYDMSDTPCTDTKPDAISDIAAGDAVGSNRAYDMTGRHVNRVSRGLYIINGKKIIVQ